jgi:hypothetical protein
MTGLILTTNRKTDLQLFSELAQRLGIKVKTLTSEELSDLGLLKAMEEGRNSRFVPEETILVKLKGNADQVLPCSRQTFK